MILSFVDKQAEALFRRLPVPKLPIDIQRTALRKLVYLHQARTLNDLRVPPGNRLEALKGARRGQHSIRINDQWRICFVRRGHDAYEVEIVDYHQEQIHARCHKIASDSSRRSAPA